MRLRSFRLPSSFYVSNLFPAGATEISGNTSGRTADKGMEGIAIAPDGRTLVGIMQNALIQDAPEGGAATSLLRVVTIDIASGCVKHQFAYLLTTGSGVSEIVALNNHEFLVDERDGKGRARQNNAKVKQLFKIDLNGAVDVSEMDGATAALNAVPKTLFLDVVAALTAGGFTAGDIPAKIEGVAFGPDIRQAGRPFTPSGSPTTTTSSRRQPTTTTLSPTPTSFSSSDSPMPIWAVRSLCRNMWRDLTTSLECTGKLRRLDRNE